jgi:carbon storage regulator
MLVLTRKAGESIRVGDGIILTVLECAGKYVRVGITAPQQLPVHREEVYLRIKEENLAAARGKENVQVLLKSAPKELGKSGLGKISGVPPDKSK